MVPMGDEQRRSGSRRSRRTSARASATPAGFVTPADVARVRAATANRKAALDAQGARRRRCRAGSRRTPAWKADREPQRGDRAGRVDDASLDDRARRRRPACGSRSSCRSRRCSPKSSSIHRVRRPAAAAARPRRRRRRRRAVLPYPRGYRVEVSLGRHELGQAGGRGQGHRRAHDDRVRARPREVRPHHADRHGRERAELDRFRI